MDNVQLELARNCYGYGCWGARYLFIGPEQGQARSENDDLKARYDAFRKLGKDGLSDCRAFHREIGEARWHREEKPPALQSTWKRLIVLLMAYLDEGTDTDNETLRAYQRDHWGSATGETCVIELSGLPANNFTIPRDRAQFRQERIATIRGKIRDSKPKPKFVVMYGKRDAESWGEIAGATLQLGVPHRVGSTLFLYAPHPLARGFGKQDWIKFGLDLKVLAATRQSTPERSEDQQ
jgi:hypothetical protein